MSTAEDERTCVDVAQGDEFFRCSECRTAFTVEFGDSRLFRDDHLCCGFDYCQFCGAKVVNE